MTGTVMVILDTTIVNIALHVIGADLMAGAGIEWVVTAYLLGVCACQPATGWLSDRLGRKPVFLFALATFTAASVLCAIAETLPFLVGARVLQGLGGGAVIPVGMAIVLELFPKSRHGRAIATWGMVAMVAPAVGPTLGGWLVTVVSWHWLFLINAPIGVVGITLGLRLLPNAQVQVRRHFDFLGLVLGSGGLSLTVLALSEANQWGWASPVTAACLTLGLTSLVVFCRHELKTAYPLIQLRMLRQRNFRVAIAVMLCVSFAQFGRLVFMALELEGLRGYTALRVGLIFLPAALATAASMQLGGWMVDRIGPRTPIIVGTATMLVGVLGLSALSLTTPVWLIVIALSMMGVSMGLVVAPAMVAGLSEMPMELLSQGTALRTLSSQVSGALAVAVLGAVVAARMGHHPSRVQAQSAYNAGFLVAAVVMMMAVGLAFRLGRGKPDLDPEIEAEVLARAAE
jgi:EmrB/QacA subfamily drug resistance transporter